MKKIFILLFGALLATALFGCSSASTPDSTSASTQTPKSTATTAETAIPTEAANAADTASSEQTEASASASGDTLNTAADEAFQTATSDSTNTLTTGDPQSQYTVLVYSNAPNQKSTVQIDYPYFGDSSFATVNQLIYDKVKSYSQEYAGTDTSTDPNSDTQVITINLTFKIAFQNSKIISMYFWGESYDSLAPHPNSEFYTLNIDLTTGKEVALTDMYTVNSDFRTAFFNKAEQTGGAKEALQAELALVADGDGTDGFSYPSYLPCYLTPDGLVVSIPIDHANGDHFEMQIAYSDVQQFYKLEQNYWENS